MKLAIALIYAVRDLVPEILKAPTHKLDRLVVLAVILVVGLLSVMVLG